MAAGDHRGRQAGCAAGTVAGTVRPELPDMLMHIYSGADLDASPTADRKAIEASMWRRSRNRGRRNTPGVGAGKTNAGPSFKLNGALAST